MALSKGPTIRVPHTGDIKERLENARQTLGLINSHYQKMEHAFKAMAKVEMKADDLSQYVNGVFPYPRDSNDKRGRKRSEENRAEAQRLFTEGRGNHLPGVAGTLWAAYNGVTEFIDHGKTKRDAAGHLDYIWFGDGAALKARAFEVAQKRLGA